MPLPPLSLNLSPADKTLFNVCVSLCSALGVKRMSIDSACLVKLWDDPEFRAEVVRTADAHRVEIVDVHAPHGLKDSIGKPLEGGLEHSNEVMLKSLRTAAEIGAKIVTMHTARVRLVDQFAPPTGPIPHADLDAAVERSLRQLEVLIPEAEKLGLVIALENLFLPSSTAAHLKRIMDKARHANLGFCYDSGHALIVEQMPGKTPEMIAGWIACGWEDGVVDFQTDQLDIMLPDVVTTHFHDNHGAGDEHLLPGDGVADWAHIAERMRRAPRLMSVQSEAGKGPAMADIKETFRKFAAAGFAV